MQITLFGGTFDPPHLGHSTIASALIEKKYADEVWFLPVGEHAFEKKFSSWEHRVRMLELVTAPNIKVEHYEIRHLGMSITFNTLNGLAAQHPEHTFSFVIGSDNLARFHEWHHYQEMLAKYQFFVYPRAGFALEPLYPNMKVVEGVQPVQVSSTEVRDRVTLGKPILDLVKPAVARYIQENKLYRKT